MQGHGSVGLHAWALVARRSRPERNSADAALGAYAEYIEPTSDKIQGSVCSVWEIAPHSPSD